MKETNNSILYTENNWVRLKVSHYPLQKEGWMDWCLWPHRPVVAISRSYGIWEREREERERGGREREREVGRGGLRHPINGLRLRQTAVNLIIALLLLLFEVVRGRQGLVSAGDPCIKYLVLLKYKDLQNRERQDLLPGHCKVPRRYQTLTTPDHLEDHFAYMTWLYDPVAGCKIQK